MVLLKHCNTIFLWHQNLSTCTWELMFRGTASPWHTLPHPFNAASAMQSKLGSFELKSGPNVVQAMSRGTRWNLEHTAQLSNLLQETMRIPDWRCIRNVLNGLHYSPTSYMYVEGSVIIYPEIFAVVYFYFQLLNSQASAMFLLFAIVFLLKHYGSHAKPLPTFTLSFSIFNATTLARNDSSYGYHRQSVWVFFGVASPRPLRALSCVSTRPCHTRKKDNRRFWGNASF